MRRIDEDFATEKRIFKQRIRQNLNANEKLKAFLDKECVTGRYIKNTANSYIRRLRNNPDKFLDLLSTLNHDMCEIRVIDRSFNWASTTEGHEYWKYLNYKYSRM